MIGGGGTEFGGEQGAVIGAELVGVQAQAEAERFRGAQDGARLVQGKHVRFAEDVAVLGEVVADDPRQHLVDHEIDVVVDAAAILVGDFVSAQKGGDVAHAGSAASCRMVRRIWSSASSDRPYPDLASMVVVPPRGTTARSGWRRRAGRRRRPRG